MTARRTEVRTSISSVVSGEYDVLAGKVSLEVKVGAGHLAVIDIDTRQARELQSVLADLLGAPLGYPQSRRPVPDFNVERVSGTLDMSSQFARGLGLEVVEAQPGTDGSL
jgi:hypothetical protein